MSLPNDVITAVESELGSKVKGHSNVGGGCIANATRLETASSAFFLKWSRDEAAPTFEPEAEGLRALREAGSNLTIPEPIAARGAQDGRPGFLVMQWIESGKRSSSFWEEFGRGLAALHRYAADRYGFPCDNFIGRLPQKNDWSQDWSEFFVTNRLEPQVRMARERGRWSTSWDGHYRRLAAKMSDLVPAKPTASSLHGDLWGGNFLVDKEGRAALVDPAAYYGHREADLGMTRLFGGFDERFYSAYQEAWPLEPGYQERLEIYNLYHLINHLNHFGSGYAGGVARILKRF